MNRRGFLKLLSLAPAAAAVAKEAAAQPVEAAPVPLPRVPLEEGLQRAALPEPSPEGFHGVWVAQGSAPWLPPTALCSRRVLYRAAERVPAGRLVALRDDGLVVLATGAPREVTGGTACSDSFDVEFPLAPASDEDNSLDNWDA